MLTIQKFKKGVAYQNEKSEKGEWKKGTSFLAGSSMTAEIEQKCIVKNKSVKI